MPATTVDLSVDLNEAGIATTPQGIGGYNSARFQVRGGTAEIDTCVVALQVSIDRDLWVTMGSVTGEGTSPLIDISGWAWARMLVVTAEGSAANGTVSLYTENVYPQADPRRYMGMDITSGKVPGLSKVNKFGRNDDLDAGTEYVWSGGGTWAAPTTARTHDIASTDANDTSAGTGARTIRVYGLDANYDLIEETVTMNGTSNVATANTYTMIYRMHLLTTGTGQTNAGTITATAQTDATVTARIEVGVGQTQMAIYAVPRNTTGYIVNYYGDLGKTNAAAVTLRLKTCDIENPTTGAIRTRHERAVSEATNAVHIFGAPHGTPLEVPEKSLVWIDATTTSNNVVVNAGFGMILDSLQV